jgi:hypothetical protein
VIEDFLVQWRKMKEALERQQERLKEEFEDEPLNDELSIAHRATHQSVGRAAQPPRPPNLSAGEEFSAKHGRSLSVGRRVLPFLY